MEYLSRIRLFIEVAKQGSFVAAATKLGITSSAVSKQIQQLEQELEVKLFQRTTRKVNLTEEGELLFKRAYKAVEDIEEARLEMKDLQLYPKGTLVVTLPVSLGLQYLKKPIVEFAKKYPEVTLDIHLEDDHVNIVEKEYDLALRIGVLEDSSLIAKKLIPTPIAVVVSPEYLKQQGEILTPENLAEHAVFRYTKNDLPHQWQYISPEKEPGIVQLKSGFKCDSVEMMKEAALAGIGIFIAPRIFMQQELKEGKLVEILTNYKTHPERNLYALYPKNRYPSRRLKIFLEDIECFLKQNLA